MHTKRHIRIANPNRWLSVRTPTVLRLAGYRVMIYCTKREHGPPHAHETNANGEVVVALATAGKGQTVRHYVACAKMRSRRLSISSPIMRNSLCAVGGAFMAKRRTPLSEILAQLPAARARYEREHKTGRHATSARYARVSGRVVMELSNGYLFGFPTKALPSFDKATAKQLAAVEVSPGGMGLHWEELDVDLEVAALVLHSSGRAAKARELARTAGSVKNPAKAAASRANGAKGGRPRKAVAR